MAVIVHNWSEFITAVGTSGAEVEFPKSLVKTADTDVDPNKLYTDANGVVQTNVQPSDLANLYESTFVLDANSPDGFPEGLTSNIVFACADFNGYGGKITNLNFGTHYFSGSNSPKIENAAFTNIISSTDRLFDSCSLKKNIVSVTLNASNATIFRLCDLDQCSTYLTTLDKTQTRTWYFNSAGNTTKNCRITIDYDSVDFWIYRSTNFYLKGSVKRLPLDQYNAYGVVDCNVTTTVDGGQNYGNSGIILVNSDKVGGSISAQYAVGVTTEQLKDAEELSRIGFPIQT